MNLLTNPTTVGLWQDVVKHAEDRCAIALKHELETYLVSLLIRYTNKPEITRQLFATAFLEALQLRERERDVSLQHVGDQCLLYAGLFPNTAERRLVKLGYFVDLGRSAYANISTKANDLFGSLALQFVALMDVLQSIREYPEMMPVEAYAQWQELGSQRAFKILQRYAANGILPFKK